MKKSFRILLLIIFVIFYGLSVGLLKDFRFAVKGLIISEKFFKKKYQTLKRNIKEKCLR